MLYILMYTNVISYRNQKLKVSSHNMRESIHIFLKEYSQDVYVYWKIPDLE